MFGLLGPGGLDFWSRRRAHAAQRRMSPDCRASLLAAMEVQIAGGVDVVTVIETFVARMDKRGRYRSDRPLVAAVSAAIRGGDPVALALRQHLREAEFAVLAAGEQSGRLAQACGTVISLGAQGKRIRAAVLEAAVAPVVYVLSLFVTLLVISTQVVPALAQVLPPDRWRGMAAVLYASTRLVSPLGLGLLGGGLVLIAVVLRMLLPRWTGPGRLLAERRVPGFGLYRDLSGVLWIGSFATLLQSGIPDTRILEMQIAQSNAWLAERLREFLLLMRNGYGIGEALMYAGPGPFDRVRPQSGDKFDFPSPEVIDDMASFAGFAAFGARLVAMRDVWLGDMEKKVKDRAGRAGMLVQGAIFIYFGVLTIGVNQLSTQIGAAVH